MNTATQAWYKTVRRVIADGDAAGNTKEIIGYQTTYDMNTPILICPERKISYKFMAAEAAYILKGQNRISVLSAVLPHFDQYSDDGIHQAGAYGPPFVDQLPYIIKTLLDDRSSRRAVLTIWRPRPGDTKDTPCTVSMQFIIRSGILHTVVNMRSSDVFTGLVYDMFCFAAMSQAVAHALNVRLGNCHIFAGSCHLYYKDLGTAKSIVSNLMPADVAFMKVNLNYFDHAELLHEASKAVNQGGCLRQMSEPGF
jgi:thymidylate synthase